MQTFLPYEDFVDSASILDRQRLGKQRVEGKQIINCLGYLNSGDIYMIDKNGRRRKRGWLNHTATQMWIGYDDALKHYVNTVIREWVVRGYNNNMEFYNIPDSFDFPHWLGDTRVHSSHRANLLRKDYEFYSKYGWVEDPTMEYFWPKGKFSYDSEKISLVS